ncbi:hypothetical protein [Brevundimonas sp. SORGH_AS_0993]|uniref:hypothetical protein n=1 Tax=Brevundimonas sp. SORGH_AS_0993 TaxID=3041794 RepID=UPI00278447E1|nr:hypothetical protein [Brevundimonas sp. SORGH_AS_0993]MDQ1154455.1 hypothetical protein [Brevundimonas sp. SORGH_AS_0993]
MSIRPLAPAGLVVTTLTAALAACAPATYSPRTPVAAAVFNENEFAWSRRSGQAAVEGRVTYAQDGRAYACVGSAGLTPDTAYTRARFRTLYGSTDRAAVPAAVVRARTVADANANYSDYVRSVRCENGRFAFTGLPDGGWFLIVPVTAPGAEGPVVLMRRVETRGGRTVNLTL